MWLHKTLTLLLLSSAIRARESNQIIYKQEGDFNLGGIFSISHDRHTCNASFGSVLHWELIEAMVYAIHDINERSDILPYHSLGFDIRDDCHSEDKALEAAIDMLSYSKDNDKEHCGTLGRDKRVVGIVGPDSSIHSVLVASVCDLEEIPLISYGAAHDELNSRTVYEYFSRSIPPHHNEALAISDLIVHFGWTYVSIVYSTDSYGVDNGLLLQQLLRSKGICIGFQGPISITSEGSVNVDFVKALLEAESPVIVFFTDAHVANVILDTIISSVESIDEFVFIGCTRWEESLYLTTSKEMKILPTGGLFLNMWMPTPESFETYLLKSNNSELHSIIESNGNWTSSHKNKAAPVIDAVYAFANALDAMVKAFCDQNISCNLTNQQIQGSSLLGYLRNVDFNGTRGRFRFDQGGSFLGKYVLKNLQWIDDQPIMVEVGHWNGVQDIKLHVINEKIQWPSDQQEIPISTCNPTCRPGRIPRLKSDGCCHYCRRCRGNTITVNEKCYDCGFLEWPNENRTVCMSITPYGVDIHHPVILSLLVLSSVGLLLCIATIAGLMKYRHSGIVKASSRELSLVHLTGLFLAFLCIGPFVVYPSEISCTINETFIALCLTFTYVPTVLKVSRIYRIFKAGKRTVKRPRFTGPTSQLVLAGILIGIQVRIYKLILSYLLFSCNHIFYATKQHQ